jgi:hypothetical protein
VTDLADQPPPRSRETVEHWVRPVSARAWRRAQEVAGVVLIVGIVAAFVLADPVEALAVAVSIAAAICAIVVGSRRIGLLRKLVAQEAAYRARVVAVARDHGTDEIRIEWSERERGYFEMRDSKLAVGDEITVLPSQGFYLYAVVAGQLVQGERA